MASVKSRSDSTSTDQALAAPDQLHDLDAVAVRQRRFPMQRAGHDLQIALHRHLLRIQAQGLDQIQNGARLDLAGLAVDFDTHDARSTSSAGAL